MREITIFILKQVYMYIGNQILEFFNMIWNLPILQSHSSFNLGVAVTSIAIVVAFIEYISNQDELKFKIRYTTRKIALIFGVFSILITFLGEFELFQKPFVFEILGAFFMIISILIYLLIILIPLKKIKIKKLKTFRIILQGALSSSYSDKSKVIKGTIELFKELLIISLYNDQAKQIFSIDFTSDVFLKYFSESGYIFEKVINFYIANEKERRRDMYHLEIFLKKLFIKSLENKESFLNMFLDEKIYPKALFYLDQVLLEEKESMIFQAIFRNIKYDLNSFGKLNYLKLVKRYFKNIFYANNHVSFENGYKKNQDFNDILISKFFNEIIDFIDSGYEKIFLKVFFDNISEISSYYKDALKTEDKSMYTKENAGKFLFNILYKLIGKYEIDDEEIFRMKVYDMYRDFLETEEGELVKNVAYNNFSIMLKEKIIGNQFPNFKGYFPPIILIYFYIFSHEIFAVQRFKPQDDNLHIPILSKLSEAFPKLYQGFRREFYDAESLPNSKEGLLADEGKKIIYRFLLSSISYNFEENSLSYYDSGKINSSKVFLNEINKLKIIDVRKF